MKITEVSGPGGQAGFTMIELVAVIAIGAVLMSIALQGFGNTTSRFATRNARQSFAAMQARTRAHAIERGDLTRLNVDPAGDRVWIEGSAGVVEALDFGTDREVDIQTGSSGLVTLCMNARGFGETSCNSFGSNTMSVSFVQGGQTSEVTILPLGQLVW